MAILHNQMIDFRIKLPEKESWDQRQAVDNKKQTLWSAMQQLIPTVWLQLVSQSEVKTIVYYDGSG